MSLVLVAPDVLETAAADLVRIGSAVTAGNLAAAIPTTQVAAAGADEVSAAIAALFGTHAREYQAAASQAATYYERFVRTLGAAATSYAGTEAAIAMSMQAALASPLLGREYRCFPGWPGFTHFQRGADVRLWSDSGDRRSLDQ